MKYVNRYVEVDIMYKVFDLQNKLLESNEWIPCRLNMKQSKKVCRRIEVRAEPMRDELSFAYDFDIDASNIIWKPLSLGDRANAFCFFWTFGGRTCELFLSFEDESTFDSYVAYLENLMFCLAKNLIVTDEEQKESDYPYPYQYPVPFYSTDAAKVISDAPENSDDDKNAETRKMAKKLHKVKPRKHRTNECDKKSVVRKFLEKKRKSFRNVFKRKIGSESLDHKLGRNSSQIAPAPVKPFTERCTFEEENNSRVFHEIEVDYPAACVLSICSPDSSILSNKPSNTNLLDADVSSKLTHVESNDSYNESDFDPSAYSEHKRSNRNLSTLSSNAENKDNSMISNCSLSSFVTAADDCDENASLIRFDFGRTPVRRKSSLGDRSTFSSDSDDEEHSVYLTCSETSLDNGNNISIDSASTKSADPLNWHRNQSMKVSLSDTVFTIRSSNFDTLVPPAETACVRNRICTPYRIKNNGTNQLKTFDKNASHDCLPTIEQFSRPRTNDHQLGINSIDRDEDSRTSSPFAASEASLQSEYTKPKSPSIFKNALCRISRIRKMTMSCLSASSRAASIFV